MWSSYASLLGFVELPAGAIKDAEGVGECSQVFFVSECQDDGGIIFYVFLLYCEIRTYLKRKLMIMFQTIWFKE